MFYWFTNNKNSEFRYCFFACLNRNTDDELRMHLSCKTVVVPRFCCLFSFSFIFILTRLWSESTSVRWSALLYWCCPPFSVLTLILVAIHLVHSDLHIQISRWSSIFCYSLRLLHSSLQKLSVCFSLIVPVMSVSVFITVINVCLNAGFCRCINVHYSTSETFYCKCCHHNYRVHWLTSQ